MVEKIYVISRLGMLNADLILNLILDFFKKRDISASGYTLYGDEVHLEEVASILKKKSRHTFLLNGNGFEIHLASVLRYQVDILSISAENGKNMFWDDWITSISEQVKVVQAWLVDADYDYWQNAEDSLQYISHGRPWEHLPKRSNGLPPPLEKQIIDTSNNPGHRRFCMGYLEAIGAVMWLGDDFWSLTGANKNDLLKQSWLKSREIPNGLLRIQVGNTLFSTASEGSDAIQLMLRGLLFPRAVAV
ncbi:MULTISPECIES: hypothetical protein [Methylomicrobium]|uniref:Uncharacterized protein n=1 Tax=Methylomicrobium album BG8 TaxID=686340 RepID=H8GJS1_METAL|nr:MULTISPECIES: hypothetical protein [Methylomicrobium]EIC31600.1 hypothetical protein Metal_3973 [Methylomicrobium album BG8]